jgi:JAB N-terminal domain
MTVEVELYRQPDYEPAGRLPLAPLLREALEPVLGRNLAGAKFLLQLSAVDDSELVTGRPSMINLRSSHGYGTVTIFETGRVIYQHPHALAEIVALPLQQLLAARFPEIGHWGFGLVGPGLEDLSRDRPTPVVPGSVPITASRQRRQAAHVEEVPDPEPPPATLGELGVLTPQEPLAGPTARPDDSAPPVAMVLRPTAYAALVERSFSDEVEEGGFVIGHHHRDADHSGRYLLEVTAVVRAESTGASLLRFTFTGESFLQLGNLLARRGGHEEILGWYHTHLFAATPEFGLSTIDVRLHTSTFRRPWQVAALVNLEADRRVLRWYGSEPGGTLAEIPYWLAEDGTRPTAAPLPTGSES